MKVRFEPAVDDQTGMSSHQQVLQSRLRVKPGRSVAADAQIPELLRRNWASPDELDRLAARYAADKSEAQRSALQFNVVCVERALRDFELRIDCPKPIRLPELDAKSTLNVPVQVVSLASLKLQPKFSAAEDTLRVTGDGLGIQLASLNTSFVTVLQSSCCVGPDIAKTTMTDAAPVTLPPQGKLKRPRRRDELCYGPTGANLTLKNVTRAAPQTQKLAYGFAVKYRRSGKSADRTLYKATTEPVSAMLASN